MTKNMYTVAGDGPCNEELALRIQAGDKNAAERLLSQNEGYLTELARAYTPWCELEDLKQEAALALLDAARRLIKEYRTLFCVRQLGDDVFSVGCGGDPAVAYDRLMRRTLLMQRIGEVLMPRELNLVRSYLGIGQPDEAGMTFQELAIYLNYNGPSGAEKAYKAALRKLKRDLYGGAYGRWLSTQRAIRAAKTESEANSGQYTTPQRTWWEEQALAERFLCEIISLIHVYEIFSDISKNEPG